MGKSQIIHTDGEDLVVIPRSDYEALLARAGDEASEDAATARIVAATDAKIARGEDVALPATVWAAIESGEHPVRAIRKYRGLTQMDVARLAGFVKAILPTSRSAGSGAPPARSKPLQPHLLCRST
jgi:hypothetical protein